MNWLIIIAISLISAFGGFASGRLGDKYGGHINAPHHWIYGLILIVIGILWFHSWLGLPCLAYGVGLFISDLNDFLQLRIWGVDKPHQWKFWSIM